MKYKWIAQDKGGLIAKYKEEPEHDHEEFLSMYEYRKVQDRYDMYIPNWSDSLINLETHDYKIEDGILMKVEKEQIFKGSELQYKSIDGTWEDCNGTEYRLKPKTKVVRFRNYLTTNGYPDVAANEKVEHNGNFVRWIGDWQEVEVPNE